MTSLTPRPMTWHPLRKSTAWFSFIFCFGFLVLSAKGVFVWFQTAGFDRPRSGQTGTRENTQQLGSFYIWDTGKQNEHPVCTCLCLFIASVFYLIFTQKCPSPPSPWLSPGNFDSKLFCVREWQHGGWKLLAFGPTELSPEGSEESSLGVMM